MIFVIYARYLGSFAFALKGIPPTVRSPSKPIFWSWECMSTYVIGDIQGCYASLQKLLAACAFDPAQDVVWLVGDLVNRGPGSLETLRFVRDLGASAKVVLGNHDLYLLMVAYGVAPKRSKDDTLQAILEAPDRELLLTWLRQQPLCHAERGFCMVHAGLLPAWSVPDALAFSEEVRTALQGENFADVLAGLWGSEPDFWSPLLTGAARLRAIVNVMTRMRFCYPDGRLNFKAKGPLEKAPKELVPWFDLPDRRFGDHILLVGHWSALGFRVMNGLISVDTGCLWGGKLSAFCLENGRLIQVDPAPEDRLEPNF